MHRVQIKVRGKVQGVGFRWFTQQAAQRYGITGWVHNLPDGSVEAQAQGQEEALSSFSKEIKSGHPYARVESFESHEIALQKTEERFIIR
jgi:acylphosphatase